MAPAWAWALAPSYQRENSSKALSRGLEQPATAASNTIEPQNFGE